MARAKGSLVIGLNPAVRQRERPKMGLGITLMLGSLYK
ncbi:hypothetical protein MIDIC_190013 [Alphaproteobacteria bacterium]